MMTRRARRGDLEPGDDSGAALAKAGDDLALGGKRWRVGFRGGEVDLGAADKAVAPGHALGMKTERRHRHDVGAVQRQQSMRRPRELDRRAIRALVAHQFGNRQLFDRIGERFVESACQRLSLGQAPQVNVVGFAIGGDVDAIRSIGGIQGSGCEMRAPEASHFFPECFGNSGGVTRRSCGHQLGDHLGVRGDRTYVRDRHREPARRRVRRGHALRIEKASLAQSRFDARSERFPEPL